VVPSLTAASGWDPVNKKLTLTGTGLETGVTYTATNGASFSGTSNASYGNTTIMDSVVLTNYVGTKDGTSTTITATNPDGSSATFTIGSPQATSAVPASIPAGTTKTVTLGGSGFKSGMTAVVTNGNGTATITAVTSSSSATMSDSPSTTGTQGVYVYNPDGGYTSTGFFTINALPTITSFSPAEVTQGVLSGTITVNGTGFQSGITGATTNGTVSSVTYSSSTKVTLKATPTNSGNDVITLTNPDGGSVSFTLVVPNITSFTPNPPTHSTATTWTVNGTGFESGATITIKENGTSLTVSNTTFVNSTKYTFKATTTSSSGSTLSFVVTLTNPDGSTDSLTQSMRPS
jgi:trimeric autotransporter adhesin